MLLYRVFGSIPNAKPGAPGHHTFLFRPQAKGRWDNPGLYDSWYLSASPEGAIGETFGNLDRWSEDMFERPYLPGGRMVLGVFSVPDDLPIFNLDDAQNLLAVDMKPSQVVIRNTPYTQARAAEIFDQGRWAGIGWWSFHRPFWSNVMLWSTAANPAPITFQQHEDLTLNHPAVSDCQRTLARLATRDGAPTA